MGVPSGIMSQNIWGAQSLRGSVETERGRVWERGVEGGVPPPTVGSFFIFPFENVQSGAYLRRKFRLDDMYYLYGIENNPWLNFFFFWGGGSSAPSSPTSTPVGVPLSR